MNLPTQYSPLRFSDKDAASKPSVSCDLHGIPMKTRRTAFGIRPMGDFALQTSLIPKGTGVNNVTDHRGQPTAGRSTSPPVGVTPQLEPCTPYDSAH